jgi:hypothetical protein
VIEQLTKDYLPIVVNDENKIGRLINGNDKNEIVEIKKLNT